MAAVCTGLVDHEYVSVPVPPAAVTVAVPVEPPKHFTFVWALMLDVSADAGCVIVAVEVVVHPLTSVTVTV